MICWQYQKLLFFLNINECSSVTKDQGQCHLLHHTEIHQLSKKWALPVTQEYVRCKIFAACSLALGRRWLCLLLGNHVLQKRKELILNACPAPFSLKGVNLKIASDHGPLGHGAQVWIKLCGFSSINHLLCIRLGQSVRHLLCSGLAWWCGRITESNMTQWLCKCHLGSLYICLRAPGWGHISKTIKVIAPCEGFMPCSLLVMI